jgi:predicted nucleic acid-binding protein
MSDKIFIDTNVLIYSFSEDEPQKQKTAMFS